MTTNTPELLPYVKPEVERIPLSEARGGDPQGTYTPSDFVTSSS
jgi:hypothetical protein